MSLIGGDIAQDRISFPASVYFVQCFNLIAFQGTFPTNLDNEA